MPCPTKNNFSGFTLVELMVVIAITSLLLGSTIAIIDPPKIFAKARDAQRMSDLSNLSAAVDHYIVDNGTPPGAKDVMHLSDSLPVGQIGPLQNANSGWIEGNLSKFTRKLFTDPTNEGNLVYRYKQDGVSFEFDCEMEVLLEQMQKDTGNSETRYEVGTKLDLL